MRNVLVFAALLVAGGVYAARAIDKTVPKEQPPMAAAAAQASALAAPAELGRTLTVRADRRGHFQVDARVDGRPMEFLVDTGATVIALRASDAARLGVHPGPRDYTAKVSTANGTVGAAPTRLARVDIGGLSVFDVAALIMPDEALGTNLLGNSFLSKLRRYEVANGRLVMEQ